MKIKLKWVVIIETIMVIALIVMLASIYYQNPAYLSNKKEKMQLLSQRVYTQVLPSQSYLILNWEPLKKDIEDYITSQKLNVSIYVLNMRNSASFGINEYAEFDPASLNKIPVAMIVLKKVEEGTLNLDMVLPIAEENRDKKYGTLYNKPIDELTVRELLHYSLAESDNTAAQVLKDYTTLTEIQHLSFYLNYYNSDINYSRTGLFGYKVTPKGISNLFSSLYLSTVLQPENSELILSLLANSSLDMNKYARLPDEVVVAHKFGVYSVGNDNSEFHDCGILYIEDSRIFYCVMTQGINQKYAIGIVGEIIHAVYNYVVEAKKVKDIHI